MTTLKEVRHLENVLQSLTDARPFALIEADQYEKRIRFHAARVDALRRPVGDEPVRADRVMMAVEILDQHLGQAETFLDHISSEILVQQVA